MFELNPLRKPFLQNRRPIPVALVLDDLHHRHADASNARGRCCSQPPGTAGEPQRVMLLARESGPEWLGRATCLPAYTHPRRVTSLLLNMLSGVKAHATPFFPWDRREVGADPRPK